MVIGMSMYYSIPNNYNNNREKLLEHIFLNIITYTILYDCGLSSRSIILSLYYVHDSNICKLILINQLFYQCLETTNRLFVA